MVTTANIHKVPRRQWRRWCYRARFAFNYVMSAMQPRQRDLFQHPRAAKVPRAHWQTTRWNAAWVAAESIEMYWQSPRGKRAARAR